MEYDLLIRHGCVVLPGTDGVPADIAIRAGRIAALFAPGNGADAAETLDASGLVVFPGAIDVHLHLGHGHDIARPRVAEDAAGETAAAVAGGVTTFIPYLLSAEPFEAIFDEVRAVTEAGTRIDFGYHFIVSTETQLAGVPRYVRLGVPSFKIFMNNRGGEGKRLGLPDIDDGFLFRLCEAAAEHGGLVCPHAENIEAAWVMRDRLMAQDPDGRGGLAAWNASRPPFVEADAVQRTALFARQTGARLYIVHTSSRACAGGGQARAPERHPHHHRDLPALPHPHGRLAAWRHRQGQSAAAGGIRLRGAVGGHRRRHGRYGRDRSHPSRPREQAGRHLEGLARPAGHRHAAAGAAERRAPSPQAAARPHRATGGGDAGRRHGACAAQGPHRGRARRRSRHRRRRRRIHPAHREHLHSSAGYSIYEGVPLRGRVRHTLVRGRFVLRDHALVADAVGTGQFIARTLS